MPIFLCNVFEKVEAGKRDLRSSRRSAFIDFMHDATSWNGILVGAVGGAIASLIFWIVGRLNEYEINCRETRRIYQWLKNETSLDGASSWRSTRAIASFTNLTEDRVRYLCSYSSKITRSSGENEFWGITEHVRPESGISK